MHNVITVVNSESHSCSVLYNKTRVIHNSNANNGCSSNWRADWSRVLGRSYAQVRPGCTVKPSVKIQKYTGKRVCSNCHQEGHFKQQCTSGPCCVVCKGKNHSPGDKECPGTAKNPHKSVTTFAGKKDVLSNFYPCDVKVFGFIHKYARSFTVNIVSPDPTTPLRTL